MEYQRSDSYLRDVKTLIRREEDTLASAYDALISAYTARDGAGLTADDARLLARSARFVDREDDVAAVLEEYAADTPLSREYAPPTTWDEVEQQLAYVSVIESDERRERVAKKTVRRGLQHLDIDG